MLKRKQTISIPKGRIEKPEDKAWQEWYNKLGVEEHEKRLKQLGLDKEDIEEWEKLENIKKSSKKTK